MKELLKRSSMYKYPGGGKKFLKVDQLEYDEYITDIFPPFEGKEIEAPIIIAAKNGVIEVVEMILEMFPMAIHELDAEGKNIVLLAIENRHILLYQFLLMRNMVKESLLEKVDYKANSALHLAAKLGVPHYNNESRLDPVAALQMHWEIKWFKFIKESVPPHFFRRYNASNQTPQEIFTESHRELVIRSIEWLKRTSESCSLVAALIATVAFATSTTIPGGVSDGDGKEAGMPNFVDRTAYKIFSIASLIALAGSINSLVLFLSILASRFHQYDFEKILPRKLMLGLMSMFLSIVSMLVSFCAAHFLGTSSKLRNTAVPIYAVACLPLTYFAFSRFPLYLSLLWSTTHEEPLVRYDDYAPL
ncbi:hypothetical protein PIB30_044673 [Stylosanthes scabra]|uniref:PGG domain-containing protein n=1 Tax=Stylosanthes scabra TaxID=79078 RepID=A0ABU6QFA5_9FABA|nr:hypothetical protein [Stylosanthes scabra]